ncbi:MAG TPA: acyl-CoA thioesterase [Pseudonocardiaceae bacterium]|jgi:acyl-CoA thioester hydrolase|nr:acyl-CoA thioesterase [Pseudonocardiaceae bacterium]
MDNGAVPFSVRIAVRNYELDALGHVNQAVYHSYAEHGRVSMFRAAGVPPEAMRELGYAPAVLTSEARYLRELRDGDEVDVRTTIEFGTGKTFVMRTELTKPDGTVAATVNGTMGLLDLTARKLLPEPRERILAMVTKPEIMFSE